MIAHISKLPAVDPETGRLNVVIDTPKGCRNKYKFDERNGLWRLSKMLPQGMSFPCDFGFIPSTRGEDGDPIDVLVFMDEPAFLGAIVPAQLIGVLEAEQTEDGKTIRNDRLVAVVAVQPSGVPFPGRRESTAGRGDRALFRFLQRGGRAEIQAIGPARPGSCAGTSGSSQSR